MQCDSWVVANCVNMKEDQIEWICFPRAKHITVHAKIYLKWRSSADEGLYLVDLLHK